MIELTQEELKQHFSEPIFGQVAETADTLGMECYVVGGYVRDIFLQRSSKDIDVVVVGSGIAMAEALGKQLGRGAHVSVFKNFGTAQVKYRGTEVEFVGARKESYQRDSRKPIVEDGTLEDDQNRRDFTINALAVCLNKARFGELVDPFGGLEDMKEKKLSLYRRKHLGYIFQMYNLIPNLTVRENIEVGAYLSDHALDVDELLDTLGLSAHQKKLPNQLSGGQQQRTAIGRAIVKNPDILLCDEPTGALDYKTSKEILKLIETVNQKYGNTVVMVTHNDAIKDMADRVVRIRDGMIRKNYLNDHKVSAQELDW